MKSDIDISKNISKISNSNNKLNNFINDTKRSQLKSIRHQYNDDLSSRKNIFEDINFINLSNNQNKNNLFDKENK